MHECDPYGKLMLNGEAMSNETIAKLLNLVNLEFETCLNKLLKSGVASRDESNSSVMCRRMVRDAEIREKRKVAGKKGGNPNLINPLVNLETVTGSYPAPDNDNDNDNDDEYLKKEESEFLKIWNACDGVAKIRKMRTDRRRCLRIRLADKTWDWRAALNKMPLRCTLGDSNSWKPDVDWFLKPHSVDKILEGKYDWTKNGKDNGKPRIGPGQAYDPEFKQTEHF